MKPGIFLFSVSLVFLTVQAKDESKHSEPRAFTSFQWVAAGFHCRGENRRRKAGRYLCRLDKLTIVPGDGGDVAAALELSSFHGNKRARMSRQSYET